MEQLGRGDHDNNESTNQNAESSPVKVDADVDKSHDNKSSNENSPSKSCSTDDVRTLQSSWQQLFEAIPHNPIPAKDSSEYTRKIYDLLHDNLDSSRNRGNTKGGLSKDSDPGGTPHTLTCHTPSHPLTGVGRSGKRMQNASSSDIVSNSEGVVLKPTPLHLASGSLSSFPLSGVHNARLEGVACFGCNVVALIEAQIADEVESSDTLVAKQPQAMPTKTLKISRKITERRRYCT